MVIEDVSAPSKPVEKQNAETSAQSAPNSLHVNSASPVDRLAALMADTVILIPLISLATSRFRRYMDVSELLQDGHGVSMSQWLTLLAALVTIISYQTFFLLRSGATPGKQIIGLKVVNLWGERLTLKQAFFRSFVWCASAFAFLLPWLGAISNSRRRPWHDRIADTQVIALKSERAVGAPDAREQGVANALTSFVVCCVVGLVIIGIAQSGQSRNERILRVGLKSSSGDSLCAAVSEAQTEWLENDGQKPSRLDAAVAMFSVGAISSECLEREAEVALWNKGDKQAAYLAKALVHDQEAGDGNDYLDQICAGANSKSPICALGKLRVGARLRNKAELLAPLLAAPPKFAFTRILLIDELVSMKRYAEALKLLDAASVPRQLSYFFARSRALALWGLKRESEARLTLQASLDGLTLPERIQMARWSCEMETLDGCNQSAAFSCKTLVNAVERAPSELEDEAVAFSWLRANECLAGKKLDAQKLKNFSPGELAQDYVGALASISSGESKQAQAQLLSLSAKTKAGSPAWYETNDHLVHLSNLGELHKLSEEWLKIEDKGDLGWIRTGRSLYRRFQNFGQQEAALRIGQSLVDTDAADDKTIKQVIATAYKTGDVQTALRLWKDVKARSVSTISDRTPASDGFNGEFEKIERELSDLHVGPPASGDR